MALLLPDIAGIRSPTLPPLDALYMDTLASPSDGSLRHEVADQ
jgi:hypothetical protein